MRNRRGTSLAETLVGMGISFVLMGVAIVPSREAVDAARIASAVRYLASELRLARMLAATRGRSVGFRFEHVDGRYLMTAVEDGNGNGIRTADIRSGIDPTVGSPRALPSIAPGVEFGLVDGVVAVDTGATMRAGDDPIRVGVSDIVSFAPTGTSTSGTLYVQGARSRQYAIRVLGATSRIRVLEFRSSNWVER